MLIPITTLGILATLAAAIRPSSFTISTLTTHQPNGNPDGQVNYYRIAFSISSINSGSQKSAYCNTFWGDNTWLDPEAYSLYVPTKKWMKCDSSHESLGDEKSAFEFKMFEGFSIGNFTVEVRETMKMGRQVYGFMKMTNETDAYVCDINPQEIQYVVHASGDCQMGDDKGPFRMQAYAKERESWGSRRGIHEKDIIDKTT